MVAKKAKPINSPRSKTLKVVRKTPINDRLMTIGNNIGEGILISRARNGMSGKFSINKIQFPINIDAMTPQNNCG